MIMSSTLKKNDTLM